MKKLIVTLVCTILTAAVAFGADFQSLVPLFKELRAGNGDHVMIRFSGETFNVLHLADSDLTAAEGKALLTKDALPRLKMTESGTWISREINKNVTVDEPLTADTRTDTTRKWRKHEWKESGTYPKADWEAFLGFALDNGLSGIDESVYDNKSTFTLSFDSVLPNQLRAGTRTLQLDNKFAAQMRVSPKYPAKAGANGFVVLLHDPHDNIAGRAETLAGLRLLISANSGEPFTFLVEGAYQDPSRNIGFSGLDMLINTSSDTSTAVVHSLLNRFMINTPLAYRLLYDRKIQATAIDNNDLLQYPAPRPNHTIRQQLNALTKLEGAIEAPGLPKEVSDVKDRVLAIVRIAFVYLVAEVNDVSDTQYVEYFTTLNKNFRAIADLAKVLNQAGVKGVTAADAAFFEQDANGYTDEAAIYQKAVDRNRTMIPFIARAAKNEAQSLPIAFIGSFHTHGIEKALQEQGIGYVVIEPRPVRASTENESREFEHAIHPNTREAYLTSVALNMGGVAPTIAEVRSLYATRMMQKSNAIRADRAATAAEVRTVGAVIDVSRLHAVADSNATLAGVVVSANGSGMNPPPGRFERAFAYFDAGDGKGGSRPRLVIMDTRDDGWRNEERYELLERAVLLPVDTNNPNRGTKMRFYTGPNLMLAVCYDRATNRTYLVEGKKAMMASFLPAALIAGGQNDVRTNVTEIFVIKRMKNG